MINFKLIIFKTTKSKFYILYTDIIIRKRNQMSNTVLSAPSPKNMVS